MTRSLCNLFFAHIIYLSVLLRVDAFVMCSDGPNRRSSALAVADNNEHRPIVVIVGAGWAGLSAADAVSMQADTILLDASPSIGGLAGGASHQGRTTEAGIHGFWREYLNTFDLLRDYFDNLDDILTPYLPSDLVSADGRVATAPVLGESNDDEDDKSSIATLLQSLPQPIDLALQANFDPNNPLNFLDRASALALADLWADFEPESRTSWLQYDQISAETIFTQPPVSRTMYRQLVEPLLAVLPMGPGYDISAAAALSCFHAFALQTKGAFDVRWCRGAVKDRVLEPVLARLQSNGVKVQTGVRVVNLERQTTNENNQKKKFCLQLQSGKRLECDAVILALGGVAAGRLAQSCDLLQPYADQWKFCRGITCVSVRLFVSQPLEALAPVTVCGPNLLPVLAETGFCVYNLSKLQADEFQDKNENVIEVDYFRADRIVDWTDEKMKRLALDSMLAAGLVSPGKVLESYIVRSCKAVTHFGLGSAALSPPVRLQEGLYMCGDWIDRTGHASWSTEKAVVTGRQAVQAFSKDFGLRETKNVIPTAPDGVLLDALRTVSKGVRRPLEGLRCTRT